jgi:hypothetical protein
MRRLRCWQLRGGTGFSGDLNRDSRKGGHTYGDGVQVGAEVVMRKIVSL